MEILDILVERFIGGAIFYVLITTVLILILNKIGVIDYIEDSISTKLPISLVSNTLVMYLGIIAVSAGLQTLATYMGVPVFIQYVVTSFIIVLGLSLNSGGNKRVIVE